jgi:glycosyltransferase involved in cell wall biosynthesis
MAPRVSVVIPSFRAERFIAATIESVLTQTMGDFELLIQDDASDDATVRTARRVVGDDPRVQIAVNATNLGPPGNWNAVVAKARAPYLKLLCSDDLITPDCLARQAEVLDANPSVGLVAARRHVIDAGGRVLFHGRGLQGLSGVMNGRAAIRAMVRCGTTPFGEPSILLLRRAALVEAGPFTDRYGTLVDCEMYSRLLRRWDCASIDDTLGAFRMSPASWSDRSHSVQGANARRLFRDLAADPELGISTVLLAQGMGRTYLNQAARRVAFSLRR